MRCATTHDGRGQTGHVTACVGRAVGPSRFTLRQGGSAVGPGRRRCDRACRTTSGRRRSRIRRCGAMRAAATGQKRRRCGPAPPTTAAAAGPTTRLEQECCSLRRCVGAAACSRSVGGLEHALVMTLPIVEPSSCMTTAPRQPPKCDCSDSRYHYTCMSMQTTACPPGRMLAPEHVVKLLREQHVRRAIRIHSAPDGLTTRADLSPRVRAVRRLHSAIGLVVLRAAACGGG